MKRTKRLLTAAIGILLALTFVLSACKKNAGAPVIGQSEFTFDKQNPANIVVEIDTKGKAFLSVSEGDSALDSSVWTFADGTLTILSGYFLTLPNGEHTYTARTEGGSANFKVTVSGDTSGEAFERPDYDVTYYDNADFNEYQKGDEVTIEGQWPGYGIGDPFIMRYNGVYYLYCSTLDSEKGVRAWKSSDLINWTQCTGEGMETGYVADDPVTRACYAPEVYYWNGTFYMYTSPGGRGHYILTADDPEGPFVPVTGNFGKSIDGSVLIEDDEQMYFTYADNGGIRMSKMTSMTEVADASILLDNTTIGSWTEGSYILKRDGTYYLTYTGNHVASDAYRVSYSVSTGSNVYSRSAFSLGALNPVLLSTDEDFKGLGHSSTFLGPDMDSYYITYHSLNNAGGPNRSLNIDRLLFNGTQMSVAANYTGSVAATLPEFSAASLSEEGKFTVSGGKTLSTSATAEMFTAEFNFSGSDDAQFIVSYVSDTDYAYVAVDFEAKTVKLMQVKGSGAEEIASGTLVNNFSENALHTVRIQYRDGKADVYFDNMQKISDAAVTLGAGKIGVSGVAQIGYVAFSNVAMGASDEREIKQSSADIGASTYMTEGLYDGITSYKLSEGSGISVIESAEALTASEFDGAKELKLANVTDFATYLVNFKETGFYGIEMVYDAAYCGKTIGIQIDGGDVMMVSLPEVDTNSRFVRALVTEFDVSQGVNQVKIENVGEEVAFVSFSFVKSAKVTPLYSNTLETYAAKGADYKTIWKLSDGGHLAQAGTRQLVYFGDETITDFTLTVEMKLVGDTATSTAGIVFRAGNYSASSHDDYRSLQGYYMSVNKTQFRLEKLNYAYTTNLTNGMKVEATASDTWFTVKIVVRGNNMKVYKNDALMLDCTDATAFTAGRLGLYTNGAAAVYKNLSVTA